MVTLAESRPIVGTPPALLEPGLRGGVDDDLFHAVPLCGGLVHRGLDTIRKSEEKCKI